MKNTWLSAEAIRAKQVRRQLERKWKSSGLESIRTVYKKACKVANRLINESRRTYFAQRVKESCSDPRKLWQTVKGILHVKRSGCGDQTGLCSAFASACAAKIDKVKEMVAGGMNNVSTTMTFIERSTPVSLNLLQPTTEAEVRKIVLLLSNKTCTT